jgi:hypothetical protein
LLSFRAVRALEARFHPSKRTAEAFIVVGRVVFSGGRRSIEPPDPVRRGTTLPSGVMLEKLEYLVGAGGGRPYESLRDLRSDYWSFVEIDDEDLTTE